MKKTLLFASVAMGIVLGAGTSYAAEIGDGVPNGGAGIRGSAHDLSTTGRTFYGTDGQDRICIWCHAPHFTAKPGSAEAEGVQYTPLWNHGVTTNSNFTLYSSGTAGPQELVSDGGTPLDPSDDVYGNHTSQTNDSEGLVGAPGDVSLLCLSCHDGSIAVNTYGFNSLNSDSTGPGGSFIDAQYLIGLMGDLSNHHPIGFPYQTVSDADDEIAHPDTLFPGTQVQIADVLYAGQMECVTCHDVHNSKNEEGAEKFLWTSNDNSDFCLTCHLKGEQYNTHTSY